MRRTFIAVLLSMFALSVQIGAQTVAARFDGRPTFKEGKALGYFIWRDGDTWKLRWTNVDGVDFKVTDPTVVIRFNLMIDGEAKPAEVEVGKENFKPNENPVRARLKL
jgi:hypothetical protein